MNNDNLDEEKNIFCDLPCLYNGELDLTSKIPELICDKKQYMPDLTCTEKINFDEISAVKNDKLKKIILRYKF